VGDLDLFGRPGSAQDHAWSVLDVTRRAKQLVESGFTRLWVRGELTGFKAYQSGHWYFSLRDAQAQVRCIMWRSDAQRVPTPPADGLDVFVEGQPTVWEERGEFRLVVRSLLPTKAAGLWEVQFQQAKAALARDGLLDPARKRPLPAFPRRIAVVTSQDGAALRDILSVLRRRWPSTEVLLLPSRVQGDDAEEELCRALALVNRLEDVDLAIVGRGGGSREDLWAFNRESVARAVAAVRVPVVSAVGHETDVALTDLVADLRAPTPSAAAEAAVPNVTDVRADVERLAVSLGNALRSRTRLGHERLARTGDLLSAEMQVILHRRRARVDQLARALGALSPLAVLARGYAIARDEQGRLLRGREQFAPHLDFILTLSDGTVPARVREA
jgi:exodeoxyribonuclease VII large subunit